jgi:hypothetical protein
MIRLAIALSFLTLVLHSSLPSWRAKYTSPIHQQCLKFTPIQNSEVSENSSRTVHQALVCGRNLKPSDSLQNWKNLGLIHILVVSGGHLTILAKTLWLVLMLIASTFNYLSRRELEHRSSLALLFSKLLVFSAVTALAIANQFEPPVLRAWLDHILRPTFKKHGWQASEASFATTWLALPAIADESDLLSLGLSFFASVVVESASRRHHDHRLLLAVMMQTYLWWALLPLLLPIGVPHPIATLSNLILAPLLGAVLIPTALFSFVFGLQEIFPLVWRTTESLIQTVATFLPHAAPAIILKESKWTVLTGLAMTIMALAIISRTAPLSRWQRKSKPRWPSWLVALTLLAIASAAHQSFIQKKRPLSPVAVITKNESKTDALELAKQAKRIRRGKVCIPYQAIERPAHNKHCRRRRSDL